LEDLRETSSGVDSPSRGSVLRRSGCAWVADDVQQRGLGAFNVRGIGLALWFGILRGWRG